MPALLRIIDANANRAREALRVIDDAARFGLDDAGLCEAAKSLRHTVNVSLGRMKPDRAALLASRDTAGDVGTAVTGAGEYVRAGLPGIVAAACGRLTEALRSIEEAAKAIGEEAVAREIEAARYRAYTLEQRLTLALGTGRTEQWRLCVLITESLCTRHSWQRTAELAVEGGADCLQLREKSLDSAEFLSRAQTLVAIARQARAAVIINDRVDVALLAEATGVHVGQTDLSVRHVRALAGSRLLVGVSTHNTEQALEAFSHGADYCGVGPMFSTTTKEISELAGPEYLHAYLDLPNARPHLAIGGVTPENIGQLSGCRGVAVSSAVCSAPDPKAVCERLRAALPA
ncbi:MAG: thiamine phosphate synthase [Planctomycetes bacterium]|nr:thiamine phosphate synthase [Planctomycetota bacterium]